LCFLPTSEKHSEELIAISDAEFARGQVKEALTSHSQISHLKKHKRCGKMHALSGTQWSTWHIHFVGSRAHHFIRNIFYCSI